jgi:ABC-type multidrug transport system fused ATPase/permease subunit
MRTFITLPRCAASMSEGFVACQRMQVFLDLPEQPKTVLKLPKDDGSHAAIEIRGPVSFTWRVGHRPHPQSFGGDSPPVTVLHDVSLSISNGSLTAVAGPIAAGKSSLLSAILGDLGVVPSSVAQPVVTVRGSVAFVPQKPWILNASLKANVLFGCQFDERKFWRVLEACSLTADVEAFPDKELTEIGEGGTTLSGGQQQRVSLARALYRDADVYLMDDVLSALDARVAREVFNNVLSSTGYLHGKTRVLVTHTLWCLPHVEDIVLMSEGRVRARGSFASLQAGGVDFAAMIHEETGDASGSSGKGVKPVK